MRRVENIFNDVFALQIPEAIENMQLPSPELLGYYRDLESRILWIDFEVNQSLLEIIKQILAWNREDKGKAYGDRKPIRLLIFSPGGELSPTLSLINVIELSKTPIYTYSMGESSSAGLYILLSGHKRYALRDTEAVLHKGSAIFGGIANQIENQTKWYKLQLNRLRDYVLDKTSLDIRAYNKKKDEDWYLTIDKMLKYGFIDSVVDNIETIIG